MRMKCFAILAFTAISVSALSQEIQRLDPSLNDLVAADAKLERIATGLNKWTEGPVWTNEGTLLFAEIPANNLDEWIPGKGVHVFMHPSGDQGSPSVWNSPANRPERRARCT